MRASAARGVRKAGAECVQIQLGAQRNMGCMAKSCIALHVNRLDCQLVCQRSACCWRSATTAPRSGCTLPHLPKLPPALLMLQINQGVSAELEHAQQVFCNRSPLHRPCSHLLAAWARNTRSADRRTAPSASALQQPFDKVLYTQTPKHPSRSCLNERRSLCQPGDQSSRGWGHQDGLACSC